jgi:hypothetical protein
MSSCCSGVVKDVREVEEGRMIATCCTCGDHCSVVTEEDLDLSVETVPMRDRLSAARNAATYWRNEARILRRKLDAVQEAAQHG